VLKELKKDKAADELTPAAQDLAAVYWAWVDLTWPNCEVRLGLHQLLQISRGVRVGVFHHLNVLLFFLEREGFNLLDHEATETALFLGAPIAETDLAASDFHELHERRVIDFAFVIELHGEGDAPFRDARAGDTDGGFFAGGVHRAFDQEWLPRHVALFIQIQEHAEVIHEFEEIEDLG
jgi:hypothetical protein